MTTLTEARKAMLVLQKFAGAMPDSLLFVSRAVTTVSAHLESQVAESQEVTELRNRLARAEGFVDEIADQAKRKSQFLRQPILQSPPPPPVGGVPPDFIPTSLQPHFPQPGPLCGCVSCLSLFSPTTSSNGKGIFAPGSGGAEYNASQFFDNGQGFLRSFAADRED